jgi:hypothetical protein
MLKRFAALLCVMTLAAIGVSAQGLDTKASRDDWEEINFEYNSSVLVDGFPSLLRLAELLQKNPSFKVKVEGHTDRLGGDRYNDRLGMARATMVRDFLVKYGARPNQIEVATRGKADPKYPGQKPVYTKTDEARWMNRRVVLTVTDAQGRTVSAGGPGEAIRAMEPAKPAQSGMADCCSEVLKRLDKLDDIARLLQNLADQNAALRRDLDALKQAQQVLESKANQPPPKSLSPEEVAGVVGKELDKRKEPRFQLLGANIGMDQNGDVTFTGRGRFFGVFAEHYAFQAQGEYLYFKGQKEGQFDLGLVDRIGRFQAGLFGSFKHVTLSGNQNGGTLGQGSITLDYLFKWGKVGLFGTKGFMDNVLINTSPTVLANGMTTFDVLNERFLKIIDQAGVSATVGLWGNNYVEANVGYLKSVAAGDRAGGTVRFIFPLNSKIAFTVEGGMNETMLSPGNTGRAVVGVQFGNMIRPKDYLGVTHPVPVDVPRVRYEVVNKVVRVGHTNPVADAGPDQIGVPAGPITLNGSGSYSPDGLPITFQWIQEGGQAVTLSSPTSAITSFPANAGQSYIFRLVVTDSLGGQGQARVHITTLANAKAQVLYFVANPGAINSGQSSTLTWRVQNATTVTISPGIGNLQLQGAIPVSPTTTTTYTLTATNATSTDTATAVVVVNSAQTKLLFCYASPTNISVGEASTLFYQSQNATSVTITPGIGSAPLGGSVTVTPTVTTNYTIVATGPGNLTDSCSVAVNVTPGTAPRIVRFSAIPATITSGQTSSLLWVVDNATTVSISTIGNVSVNGSQDVSPTTTTTYTLTATNATGSVTAQATVTVTAAGPVITFTAVPNPSPSPGSPVVLTCSATNATSINLNGTAGGPGPVTVTVNPQQTTTYTCTATGNGQTSQQSLTVTVGGGGNTPPTIVVAGGLNQNTIFRFITLDASKSFSPSGNNPLTYKWVSVNDRSLVLNANSPTPNIQLGMFGDVYLFNLTVTDSKGNSSTVVVAVKLTI